MLLSTISVRQWSMIAMARSALWLSCSTASIHPVRDAHLYTSVLFCTFGRGMSRRPCGMVVRRISYKATAFELRECYGRGLAGEATIRRAQLEVVFKAV